MTARDVFLVVVRTIGLVWFLTGLIATMNRAISCIFSPVQYADPYSELVIAVVAACSGLAFLLAARFVVRLIYGHENSN